MLRFKGLTDIHSLHDLKFKIATNKKKSQKNKNWGAPKKKNPFLWIIAIINRVTSCSNKIMTVSVLIKRCALRFDTEDIKASSYGIFVPYDKGCLSFQKLNSSCFHTLNHEMHFTLRLLS